MKRGVLLQRRLLFSLLLILSVVFSALVVADILGIAAEADEDTSWNITFDRVGNDDTILDLEIDSQGNVYAVGYSKFTEDSGYEEDVIIKKYYPNGTEDEVNWNKTLPLSLDNADIAYAAALDSGDNLYVVGYFTNATLGGLQGFVLGYNSSGSQNTTWNITKGHGQASAYYDALFDSSDNLYIVGIASNYVNASTNVDILVEKYFSNATQDSSWNISADDGTGGDDVAYSAALDSSGNLYVAGVFGDISGDSSSDWFLKKYFSNGTEDISWNHTVDSTGSTDSTARKVVVDADDSVYILGNHFNSTLFSDTWLIQKYYSNGTQDETWNITVGNMSESAGVAIDIYGAVFDSAGSLYVGGKGSYLLSSTSEDDWLIKKFLSNSTEDFTWNLTFDGGTLGDSNDSEIRALALDSFGSLYVGGHAKHMINSTSEEDLWLKKFDGAPLGCMNITADITINANISPTTDCFVVTGSNLVIDGAGNRLVGDGGASDVGFEVDGDNVTIKNFAMIAGFQHGILVQGSNVTIENNTFLTNSTNNRGITVSTGENAILANNTFNATSDDSVYLISGINHLVTHNTFYLSATVNYAVAAIGGANYTNITHNTVTLSDGFGIGSGLGAHNNYIYNNTIVANGPASSGAILIVNDASNTTVDSNNITVSSGSFGIAISNSTGPIKPQNNTVLNNYISNSGASSIAFSGDGYAGNTNTIVYNSSYGEISWIVENGTSNMSFILASTVFLSEGLVGLATDSETLELNSSATIKFFGLSYSNTPYLLKDGTRCDDGDSCNVSYSGGVLTANVSSFSNYTLESTDPSSSSSSSSSSGGSSGGGGSSCPLGFGYEFVDGKCQKIENVTSSDGVDGEDSLGDGVSQEAEQQEEGSVDSGVDTAQDIDASQEGTSLQQAFSTNGGKALAILVVVLLLLFFGYFIYNHHKK